MYRNQRIVAVVQARMGSSRLPGKVLLPLGGRPVLWHVIERLTEVDLLDEIVVATTERPEDDGIVDFVRWIDEPALRVFRGPEKDVLERFYLALCDEPPDVVVRVTADSPLVSTEYMRQLVIRVVEDDLDGADGHHDNCGLTLGFGSEAYRYRALVDAHLLAIRPEEREHVSLFIRHRPHAFRLANPEPESGLCSDLRLTLDYPEDLELLSRVYDALYRPGRLVDCRRVLEWLERRPDLVAINGDCDQIQPLTTRSIHAGDADASRAAGE